MWVSQRELDLPAMTATGMRGAITRRLVDQPVLTPCRRAAPSGPGHMITSADVEAARSGAHPGPPRGAWV